MQIPLSVCTSHTSSSLPFKQQQVDISLCPVQEALPGDSQEEVRSWFQQALGIRCCLVRQRPGSRKPITPMQLGKDDGQHASGHIGNLLSLARCFTQ